MPDVGRTIQYDVGQRRSRKTHSPGDWRVSLDELPAIEAIKKEKKMKAVRCNI